MTTYIALFRGINVGGNNKVSMAELKVVFETAGFSHVSTYINSGNVIFSSERNDPAALVTEIEQLTLQNFRVASRVSVITVNELHDALAHAPSWWDNDTDSKHNAIFVIAPAKPDAIMHEVGEAKPDYEKVGHYGNVIFWSAPLKTFGRTRWSKIVGTKAYQDITIRNANTTKRLAELTTSAPN
jgi:uncharacterized protein (DUF1697 family)